MAQNYIKKTTDAIKATLDETLNKYLSIQAQIEKRSKVESTFYGSDEYIDLKAEQLFLGKKHQKLADALVIINQWM